MSIQKVIITGGANGVGRALVRRCLDDGQTVIACDIDEPALKELAAEHEGRPLEVHTCDVGSHESVDAFLDVVLAEHPDVRGLVNNAGLYLGPVSYTHLTLPTNREV